MFPDLTHRIWTARFVTAVVAVAILPGLTGCYKDRGGFDRAATDASGTLHVPTDGLKPLPMNAETTRKQDDLTKASDSTAPTEADLGLPFYPGAKPHTGLDGFDKSSKDQDGMTTVLLETGDPVDSVAAFYRSRFSGATQREDTDAGKRVVSFSAPWKGNGLHSVEISEGEGKTLITLLSIPEDKSLIPPPAAVTAPPLSAGPESTSPAMTGKYPSSGAPLLGPTPPKAGLPKLTPKHSGTLPTGPIITPPAKGTFDLKGTLEPTIPLPSVDPPPTAR